MAVCEFCIFAFLHWIAWACVLSDSLQQGERERERERKRDRVVAGSLRQKRETEGGEKRL